MKIVLNIFFFFQIWKSTNDIFCNPFREKKNQTILNLFKLSYTYYPKNPFLYRAT